MLSSHTVGFQRPDNSNLANLTPGLCSSSWSWSIPTPQSSISETLEYLEYLLLTNLAARRCTLSILSLLYFGTGPKQWRHTP